MPESRDPFPQRAATTLPEVIVVVALIALVSGFTLPPLKRGYDRIETRAAARATMMAFFVARAHAVAAGRRTGVLIDAPTQRVIVVSESDTLMMRPVGIEYGVTITSTRDSMTYFPDGLGLGAANLSVILRRGAATDTVLVSREGRVKLGARAR